MDNLLSQAQKFLAEYTPLKRRDSDMLETRLTCRLIKRRLHFTDMRILFDIRECIIKDGKVFFTRKGVSLYPHEIQTMIENLQKAQRDIESYGTHARDRKPDTSTNSN